jgi:hypothetical protein
MLEFRNYKVGVVRLYVFMLGACGSNTCLWFMMCRDGAFYRLSHSVSGIPIQEDELGSICKSHETRDTMKHYSKILKFETIY